jgi:phosphate transport system permease protein
MSSGTSLGAPLPAPGPAPNNRHKKAVESSSTWSLLDRMGLAFAWFLGLMFCVIIAAVVVFLIIQGVRYMHLSWLWTNPSVASSGAVSGGFLDPILGTLIAVGLAMAIATPVGVGVAVWLTEYARPRWLARVVESTVEMLAGTPSVVLALFGLVIFAAPFLGFISEVNGGVVYGKSFLVIAPILALLGLPYVVSTTREGLQAIPNHVREASYAIGKTRIATIRRVLLPATRPSIITGSMVGAGHVVGDTAIILYLLGDTPAWHSGSSVPVLGVLQGTGQTLTSYIFDNAPTGDLNDPHRAYAAALVLLAIVLLLNLTVDLFKRQRI